MRAFRIFSTFSLFVLSIPCWAFFAMPKRSGINVVPPVVMNKKVQQRLKDLVPNNISVVTHQQIVASGATNVGEVLQMFAGVHIEGIQSNNSQIAVSMRGFGATAASNTLILLNGVPLINPDVAAPNLNDIDVDNIQRIEVIHGSAGTLYGNQAVGGVINIITRKPTKPEASIKMSYGSYNRRSADVNVSNKTKQQIGYRLNARKYLTDNYRRHNNYDAANLNGLITYHYHSGSIYASYHFITHKQLLAGALTAQQVQQDRRQTEDDINFINENIDRLQWGYKQNIAQHWQLKLQGLYRQFHGDGIIVLPVAQYRHVLTIRPHLLGTFPLKQGPVTVTLGAGYDKDSYQLMGFTQSRDQQSNGSLYFQLGIPMKKDFGLMLGSRYAQLSGSLLNEGMLQDIHDQAFVFELALIKKFNHNFRVFIRRDGNFRFPKADENSLLAKGISQLKTQTGVTYETGVAWKGDKSSVAITAYILDLDNEIAFDPRQTVDTPFGANRNLPPTKRTGVTISGSYEVNAKWRINGSYSFVNARFSQGVNQGKRIPLVAEDLAKFVAIYHFKSYWHLSLEDVYTGNRFPAGDDNNMTQALGGYMLININLRYESKHWDISSRINNLTNTEYITTATLNISTEQVFFYPAPTRNYVVTVTYKFV